MKQGKTGFVFFSFLSVFLLLGLVQSASAALQAVGPVNPTTGFPAWYQDTNGLAVEQCFDPANPLCLADPVIVGNGFSEQIGFGAEAFYWTTEALMDSIKADGTGGKALMVLALENAWLNEEPVQGDQMVFGRIRFFIDVPAAGRYTITHPFGVAFFDVSQERITATNGIRAINANRLAESGYNAALSTNIPLGDFGCEFGPCDFSLALGGGVGPFLRWDTGFPVIGADGRSYLGDAVTEHTITGSPFGTNFLKIEGPEGIDLDPNTAGIQNVIETDLFVVSGRIAVIDTIAPTIGATSPAAVPVGSTNMVATVQITDDLGVAQTNGVKIDLGPLGNTFTATLNGAQEVPPTASSATGSGTFTIDTAANTLSFDINFAGLPAGDVETTPHIHNAPAGVNGPSVFDLPVAAVKNGVWNYPEALESEILAGNTYVQIHSLLFPNGAIRGQILPTANVQNMILTAGTRTAGTWGIVIPSVTRLGTFNLPITATDGSNVANGNLALSVVPLLSSVTVTPAASTILAGSTQQLSASGFDVDGVQIVPAPSIAWSSSNISAATVDASGLVTAVDPGTATITATGTLAGISASGTSTINVNAVPVLTSVSVTPSTGTVNIGETLQLTANPLDQNSAPFVGAVISWSSSNTAVATVGASGLVTGVAEGTATITATATSGAVNVAGTSAITVITVAACQTGADTNGDRTISNLEILNYVRDWKSGTVSNLLVLQAIRFWKAGAGC